MTRLSILAVSMALLPNFSHAQTNCATRDSLVQNLEVKYGEVFTGGGMQNTQQIVEVWHSEAKGTWTILLTRADGVSCIMASGTNWLEGDHLAEPVKGIQG